MHKIGIIQFPGSNTELETFMACERVGMEPIEVLWNSSQKILSDMVGYIIIGGFSYEDRSRAGVIAALDPIIQQIKIFNIDKNLSLAIPGKDSSHLANYMIELL